MKKSEALKRLILREYRMVTSDNPAYKYVYDTFPSYNENEYQTQISKFMEGYSKFVGRPIDEHMFEEVKLILQELERHKSADAVARASGEFIEEASMKAYLKKHPYFDYGLID